MAVKKESSKNSQGAFALLIILLFFLALINISAILLMRPSISPPQQQDSQEESGKVTEVLDGESFTLDNGRIVKLIGVDAPELGGKYYEESKRFLEFMVLDKTITLEKDIEDKDSSGRLLRYAHVVYNMEELFVNLESVRQGYSLPFHTGQNVRHRAEIEQARTECIKNQLNLCGI
ncbi:MAG: thermonuclease family protein [Nanoarchaeota archaeon]|nr:thermonuclease family protein [Nanoarchaeota archaeon]